jgi:hypothetical protein
LKSDRKAREIMDEYESGKKVVLQFDCVVVAVVLEEDSQSQLKSDHEVGCLAPSVAHLSKNRHPN